MENKVLDLSSLDKTKVTIKNNGEERDIYLNLSDMNIIARFQEKYAELNTIAEKAKDFNYSANDVEATLKLGVAFKDLDNEVRGIVDYIFDAPVSEVCMPFGSSFDIVNGKPRYEYVLDGLTSLYADNIADETKKLQHIKKHADKYLKS